MKSQPGGCIRYGGNLLWASGKIRLAALNLMAHRMSRGTPCDTASDIPLQNHLLSVNPGDYGSRTSFGTPRCASQCGAPRDVYELHGQDIRPILIVKRWIGHQDFRRGLSSMDTCAGSQMQCRVSLKHTIRDLTWVLQTAARRHWY